MSITLVTRTDDRGSFRSNFDVNQVVLKDKLGIRVLGLYDDKRFELKPAQDLTRRLQAAVTVRPSNGGKYLAVTVTIVASSRAQLDAIYHELVACEQVLVAL